MSVTLFVTILTVGAAVSSLLTESIKKCYQNAKKDYSANMVALVNSIIIGCGGCAVAYMLLGIHWTVNNIVCIFLMAICVWVGSMIGYDKIIQLISQVKMEKTEVSEEESTMGGD